jgi:Flp pilus assembly protein TadD
MLEVARYEAAIDAFRKAIAVNPRSVEAHNNLGIALGSLGRLDEAIAAFEQALRIQPDFTDAVKNLATAKAAIKSK